MGREGFGRCEPTSCVAGILVDISHDPTGGQQLDAARIGRGTVDMTSIATGAAGLSKNPHNLIQSAR